MKAGRLERVRRALADLELEAMLVTTPANVRYLSGFSSPEDGRVLLLPDRTALITDDRYAVQAEEETELEIVLTREPFEFVAANSAPLRLGVEREHLTLAAHDRLAKLLGHPPEAVASPVTPLRRVKDDQELALLRTAGRVTDEAFAAILEAVVPGASEVELALRLERHMRTAGAEDGGTSFIVASGPRGAMPHGLASARKLRAGELITFDFGARFGGYHADMTRTVALGTVPQRLQVVYHAVLEAQQAALERVRPGIAGRELDRVAREVLTRYGLDTAFGHSLGHGVGLQIHEAPGLSQRSHDVLEPGMVVTIEPGVYLPGEGGVRIEDFVVVTEDGFEQLSSSPKEYLPL